MPSTPPPCRTCHRRTRSRPLPGRRFRRSSPRYSWRYRAGRRTRRAPAGPGQGTSSRRETGLAAPPRRTARGQSVAQFKRLAAANSCARAASRPPARLGSAAVSLRSQTSLSLAYKVGENGILFLGSGRTCGLAAGDPASGLAEPSLMSRPVGHVFHAELLVDRAALGGRAVVAVEPGCDDLRSRCVREHVPR